MRAKRSAAERRNRMRDNNRKVVVDMPFIAPELIIQAKQMDLLTYLKL